MSELMINSAGQTREAADDGQAQYLEALGFRSATPEEAVADADRKARDAELQTPFAQLQTGVESTASSLTAGLSDAALSSVAPEYHADMQRRRELNPLADTVGQGVGLASMLIPGTGAVRAAGAAARVGEGVSLASRLGRVAETAIAHTPVGLATRAGEAAAGVVGRALPAAESLAGRAAVGAARLGVGGVVEGSLLGGVQAAASAMENQDWDHVAEHALAGAGRGALWGAAAGALVGGAIPVAGGALKRLTSDDVLVATRREHTVKALGGRGTEARKLYGGDGARVDRMADALHEKGLINAFKERASSDMVKAVDEAKDAVGKTIGELRTKVDDLAKKTGDTDLTPNMQSYVDKMEELRSVADDPLAAPGFVDELRAAERAMKPLDTVLEAGKPVSAAELQKVVQNIDKYELWTVTGGQGGVRTPKPGSDILRDVRNVLRAEHDATLARALDKSPELGNIDMYRKAMRDYGGLADASDVLHKRVPMEFGNNTFSLDDSGVGNTMAGLVGGANALEKVLSGGAAALDIATSMGVGYGMKYVSQAANKLIASRANTTLAAAANAILKGRKNMDRSVAQFITSAATKASRIPRVAATMAITAPSREKKKSDYEGTLKALNAARAGATAAASSEDRAVQAVAAKQLTAIEYLQSTKPIAMKPSNPFSRVNPQPHPVDVARWMRRVEVANKPLSVVDHMKRGTLTKEHVETLQVVYPKLYIDLRDSVERQLSSSKMPFDPSSQATLKTLFGLWNPKDIADKQANFAPAPQPQPPAMPQPTEPVRVSDSHKTQLQRLGAI
jgi:hypothetical protein